MVKKENKKHPFCTVQNCQCSNAREDHDYPTVDSTNNWRDCLLCLLSEIVLKLKENKENP